MIKLWSSDGTFEHVTSDTLRVWVIAQSPVRIPANIELRLLPPGNGEDGG
jgi:hypothetical protein